LPKAVLKKLGNQGLVLGQGGNAIAEIAGREYTQLTPKSARTATVIGHGDDRRNVIGVSLQSA
jgi:hypothetical protein